MHTRVKCGTAKVDVLNVYIPPVNSCESRYLPNISQFLDANNLLVLGDVNAHYYLWYSVLDNDKEDQLWQSRLTTPYFTR